MGLEAPAMPALETIRLRYDLVSASLFIGEQVSRDILLAHRFVDGMASTHGEVPPTIMVLQPAGYRCALGIGLAAI